MSAPDRLYGEPHADVLYDDPATVWECCIEGQYDDSDEEWTVEEWTVRPAISTVPSVAWILDMIEDHIADCGEFTEDPFPKALRDDADCISLAEGLRFHIATRATWHQADKKVATHTITLGADGKPLLNGEPMYVKRANP